MNMRTRCFGDVGRAQVSSSCLEAQRCRRHHAQPSRSAMENLVEMLQREAKCGTRSHVDVSCRRNKTLRHIAHTMAFAISHLTLCKCWTPDWRHPSSGDMRYFVKKIVIAQTYPLDGSRGYYYHGAMWSH